jgi:sphingolipid 4-desaturase/C4-monooxygenase
MSAAPSRSQPHVGAQRAGAPIRVVAPIDQHTEAAAWHDARRRRLLAEHPELRRLFGPYPGTALWIVILVAAQFAVSVELRGRPLWIVAFAILFVGAPIAHALGVLIHECAHNLVFHATWANKLVAIVANLGVGPPGAVAFRHQHLLHHAYLGDGREPDGGDTQAPTVREIEWTGRSPLRKLFAFAFGRFIFNGRSTDNAPRDGWRIANEWVCWLAMASLLLFVGVRSASYVMLSAFFAFGPHPLGARRISEHITLRRGQPTLSYYGSANLISFDVGYHVEHHDFPRVAWRYLRRLRKTAEPHYEPLASVKSWSRLLARFVVDPMWHRGQYVGFSSDYVEESENQAGGATLRQSSEPSTASRTSPMRHAAGEG